MATVEPQPRVVVLPSALAGDLRTASWNAKRSISDLIRSRVGEFLADPTKVNTWPPDPGTGGESRVRMGIKLALGTWEPLRHAAFDLRVHPTTVIRRAARSIVNEHVPNDEQTPHSKTGSKE